jgi:dihydrofolate synthase/folylpolyglutamate synthase
LKNIPGVLKVIELLDGHGYSISEDQIISGLSQVGKSTGFKGRWQKLSDAPLIICDTAHNEAGIKLIFDQIGHLDFERLYVIWGAVEGKSLVRYFSVFAKRCFLLFLPTRCSESPES